MSEQFLAVFQGEDTPSDWSRRDTERGPFRCCYCGKMVEDADGKWVRRDDYPASAMPGQFMAVHRVECRRKAKRWWPW